jgi:hypothetical protein
MEGEEYKETERFTHSACVEKRTKRKRREEYGANLSILLYFFSIPFQSLGNLKIKPSLFLLLVWHHTHGHYSLTHAYLNEIAQNTIIVLQWV